MKSSARWPLMVVLVLFGGVALGFVASPWLRGQATAVPVMPRELTSYRDVVKRVLPAVVSIETKVKPVSTKMRQPNRRRLPFDDLQIPEEFRRFFQEFDIPELPPQQGFGSGFVVDPKGVVLTNYHVVEGADQVEIHFMDGRKFVSKEINADPKTDLAIVRIDPRGAALPFIELGDSDAMEIGDRVLAFGAPFGLTGSVSAGIISGKGRSGLNMNMYEDFIQTDAAINPGNSGGPLVNLEGRVIGINSAIKSRSGGFQGVGLAINSNLAKQVLTQLVTSGTVKRGYLGVQIKDLDPEVAERLGLKEHAGVVIGHVHERTPAAKAGLLAGDIVTAINGKPVKDSRELQRIVAGLPLGKPVNITVLRDGQYKTLSVIIEEQPAEFGATRVPLPRTPRRDTPTVSLERLGLALTDLNPELAESLGYPADAAGAVITAVEPGSIADLAGLRRGALITRVEKQPVRNARECRELMERQSLEKGVLLQVQTPQGGVSYLVLKAEDAG
ncbi:MAG: Do family serine endopeptidase [Gemmataceae bacterium]|nr:Do family serine endopeptidase [Gemmataceae bacterium]MDW8265472.1 Do family serine endopeptidase [Gemmataceae bacterium]